MKSALRYAMFSLLMCVPAHAHEIESGSVMACDTQGAGRAICSTVRRKPAASDQRCQFRGAQSKCLCRHRCSLCAGSLARRGPKQIACVRDHSGSWWSAQPRNTDTGRSNRLFFSRP